MYKSQLCFQSKYLFFYKPPNTFHTESKPLAPSEAVPQSFVLAQKGESALCSNFPEAPTPMQVETTNNTSSTASPTKPASTPAPVPAPAPIDKLTTQEFLSMAEEAQKTQNFTPLIRKIGIVFSTSESLNNSFLKQDAPVNLTFFRTF